METENASSERLLTSHEVGALLQVSHSSVNKWVADGRIPAFRTPGGHRRIRMGDLLTFLRTHHMPIPETLGSAGRKRLLVVDDNDRWLSALKRALKRHADAVEVAVANNGIDALVLVGSFKPHLIMLDVYMPEIDGIEVCRRLKGNPLTSTIDVVMASGQMTAELERRALSAGARRCLRKPFELSLLLDDLGIRPALRTRA